MYRPLTAREEAEQFLLGITERQRSTITFEEVQESIERERARAKKIALSRISQRFTKASFVDLSTKGEELQGHVEAIIENWGSAGSEGIVIHGNVGTGKTHALSAIWRHLAELDPRLCGYFDSYANFVQEIRDEFSNGLYGEDFSVWRQVVGVSQRRAFVILDDVGSSRLTDFEVEKLYLVLDKRLNDYLPTIITTNVSAENFEEVFGSRIASRLGLLQRIEMSGVDVREYVKKEIQK